MNGRFPRTAGEFEEAGREVAVRCECGRGAPPVFLKQGSIVQRFGQGFDLYEGFAELRAAFPCEACNLPAAITFAPVARDRAKPVSYEEATNAILELRAFALAMDAADLGVSQGELRRRAWNGTSGRIRKFGPWRR